MRWFGQRVFESLVVVWLAATIAFFALRLLPGDAIESTLLQSGAPADVIADRRAALSLDQPILVQYGAYFARVLQGDLGVSLRSGLPVVDLIIQQLVPTFTLAALAFGLAGVLGILLGTIESTTHWSGHLARLVIDLSFSMPIYWTGTLAIFVFTVVLGLFPSGGAGRATQLVLPVSVLGFHTSGAVARVLSGQIRHYRGAPFVIAARGRGLSEQTLFWNHILRPALPPVINILALQAGFLLSGTVITETLFVRPGLGRLLLDATLTQDYPLVQGLVIVAALIYTLMLMLADVLTRLFDPRIVF